MGTPFYTPWEGALYGEQPLRLLLLGESHYGEDADHADATIKNTSLYVNDKMNHRFWTNVMKTVLGPESVMGRREFWSRMVLYNYVQQSVGERAGMRPLKAQFTASEEAFFTVIDRLKPHAILALSKTLWNNMPSSGERSHPGPELESNGERRASWIYTHVGGPALTTWIRHPSRYFSWSSHDVVSALLAASKSHNEPQ